jgi:hypothetical protein
MVGSKLSKRSRKWCSKLPLGCGVVESIKNADEQLWLETREPAASRKLHASLRLVAAYRSA